MSSVSKSTPFSCKGLIMVLTAAVFWALSGIVAQELFRYEGFTTDWLVTVRLLISGILLLLMCSLQTGIQKVTAIWRQPRDCIKLLVFAFFGQLGVQYTFFAAIETGNAATATLLQYLAPIFITLFVAVLVWKMPTLRELLAVGFAVFGLFLLITNGSFNKLSVSPQAVFWGISSAIALAFYTLFPKQLVNRYGSTAIIGWSMTLGGLAMSFFTHPWQLNRQHWTSQTALYVCFVILFGTLLAFYLYIDSLRYLKPNEASIFAIAEPLTVTIVAAVWLGVPMRLFEIMGSICIISTMTILSVQSKPKPQKLTAPNQLNHN